ncbi:hypothetical protein V490_01494 [Pseudogymnoascus sp. VKM F-3557]|nr:hypothetical protein V490_01494 [Pseudogymnoascus sp. VKM F-3557]
MTRKAFVADVAAATNSTINNIDDVQIGEEGEDFTFVFTTGSGDPVCIRALATDTSAYPKGNTYFLGVDSISAPPAFARELEGIQSTLTGLTVQGLLSKAAITLRSLAIGSREDPFCIDEDEDVIMGGSFEDDHLSNHGYEAQDNDTQDNDEDDEDYDNDWAPGSPFSDIFMPSANITMDPSRLRAIQRRIIQDVTRAKLAGFRVGILTGMRAESSDSILSISVKVAHLGLSEQAIEAWDLEPHQYIVLLIHYAGPYASFQKVMATGVRQLQIEFRLGVCNRYKPRLSDAVAAFSTSKLQTTDILSTELGETPEDDDDRKFHTLFISSPMNQLINDRFLNLLKIRKNEGLGWEGAKHFYDLHQSRAAMASELQVDPSALQDDTKKDLPPLATIDHLEDSDDEDYSLPLIAMQFALRYLIRCTEFCLVCHKKTEDSFEALKPYVCSNPLCLYQYMALGFGPSIEHSVETQPYVVDLLVSFAYSSAHRRSMRKYPIGMGLVVAQPVPNATSAATAGATSSTSPKDPLDAESKVQGIHAVDFIMSQREVIMDAEDLCDVRVGDWVEITTQDATQAPGNNVFHFRVTSYMHPHMHLVNSGIEAFTPFSGGVSMPPIIQESNVGYTPSRNDTTAPPSKDRARVKLAVFQKKFDDLSNPQKDETILALLRNMPSINEMIAYIQKMKAIGEPSFRNWTDRLCPAALGLLRWIVASNLSCIVQVDKYPGQPEPDAFSKDAARLGQKVTNLSGWAQFRFAQGAPDKEQKFHKALLDKKGSISAEFPTLFAWHGSSVNNWHSIIRSGLDFSQTSNGRAFGDGCYHSSDFQTSLGYCAGRGTGGVYPCDAGLRYWPGSNLKITQAICLNEIVNAPQEYTSSSPHLVVQHVDWIQCRYLFVRCDDVPAVVHNGNVLNSPVDPEAIQYIKQDPTRQVIGLDRKALKIPRSAFPSSRTFSIENGAAASKKKQDPPGNPPKKQKHRSLTNIFFKNQATEEDDDGDLTDDSDIEDINFLIDDEECQPKAKVDAVPQTDFVPGSLDRSSIKLLGPPSYATPAATNMLARDLQTLLKVQSATPLHELGWYIDGDSIDNIYQWIVELHSFDPKLPLSKDMKEANISSVVLEMRFGKNYPMSPPFVRVIRPRFMPFMSGGGGHVTAGGALCMELLTNSGWSAVSSIESVLLQVRMAIASMDPRPARLDKGYRSDYGVGEAIDAYLRACRAHGWEASDMGEFREGASMAN